MSALSWTQHIYVRDSSFEKGQDAILELLASCMSQQIKTEHLVTMTEETFAFLNNSCNNIWKLGRKKESVRRKVQY